RAERRDRRELHRFESDRSLKGGPLDEREEAGGDRRDREHLGAAPLIEQLGGRPLLLPLAKDVKQERPGDGGRRPFVEEPPELRRARLGKDVIGDHLRLGSRIAHRAPAPSYTNQSRLVSPTHASAIGSSFTISSARCFVASTRRMFGRSVDSIFAFEASSV